MVANDSFLSHWKDLIIIWIAFNFVSAMPAPAETGATSQWWYKWLFGAFNGLKGSMPRVASVMFPESAVTKLLPGQPPDSTK